MEQKPLVLVGGGGHCKSVIDVAESAGYTILGILDKPSELGKSVLSYQVIGNDNDIPQYVDKAQFLVSVRQIKDASLCIKLHEMIIREGGRLATVIASDAYVSKYATIGDGTVIMHNAIVNAGAVIGQGCIINTFANVEHGVVIGDYCHISTGAMINGGCSIGNGCFIGSQSVLVQGVTIGADRIVGAGSIVVENLLQSGVYVGVPIKYEGRGKNLISEYSRTFLYFMPQYTNRDVA